jgi:hypothetical protein
LLGFLSLQKPALEELSAYRIDVTNVISSIHVETITFHRSKSRIGEEQP